MDIQQLEYFVRVAELEHISKAAESLNLSQPALSANIRKLEAELGTELFTRKGKRLELNDYGEYLLRELPPLLEKLKNAFYTVGEMKHARQNEIAIDAEPLYTFPGLMGKWVLFRQPCRKSQ